jgi:heat shock protein HtpX
VLYDQIDRNRRATVVLFVLFVLVVLAVAWTLDLLFINSGHWAPPTVLGALLAGGASAFAWFAADNVVVSALGVRPPNADHPREAQLEGIVESVALAAGIPTPKVYVIDDPAPNALATGRTPDKGVVAFTTGLLDKMSRPQVEAVAAHEVSHIANRDSMVGVVAAVLVGVVIIVTRFALRLLFYGGGRRRGGGRDAGGSGPLIILGLAVLVLAPLFALLLRLAISRRRESLADANAVRLTRNPDAMIGALEVLAGDHASVDFQHGFAAHLWIEEPEDPQGQGFVDRLFATHPPIPERIKALKAIAGDARYR